MLPPVRATSSASPDYQAQAQQIVARPRLDLSSAHMRAVANDMPLSGGRLDILSLSGQLQLAQGSSIFAETIGELLDMPRGENEPLTDYAQRLTEAVRAMAPGERAVLERMLNQLVKGVSVRLLAEILNNPSGLEAAKLAMSIEGAQSTNPDRATSAVVSSYRQNGEEAVPTGAALPARNPAAVPTDGQPTTAPQVQAATTSPAASRSTTTPLAPVSQEAADEEVATTVEFVEIGEVDAETVSDGDEIRVDGATRRIALPGRPFQNIQANEASRSRQPASPALDGHGVAPGAAAGAMKASSTAQASTSQPNGAARSVPTPPTQTAGVPSDATRVQGQEATAASQKSANGSVATAFGRLADSDRHSRPEAGKDARPAGQTLPTALSEWLAEVFAADLNDASALPKLLARAPETSLDEVLRRLFGRSPASAAPQQAEVPHSAMPENNPPAGNGVPPDTLAAEERHSAATANPKAANPDLPDPLEARLLTMPPLPMMMREGVALPFVPYPPAEEEEEREERKAKQVDEIGEDKEDDAPADQSFHEHDETDENDEGDDSDERSEAKNGQDDDGGGRANDLYWRMAGWA